jgi:hypothetical protein
MTMWTSDELTAIETTDEVQLAPRRRDGSLATARTVWAVRVGDDVFARSVNGPSAAWYSGVQERHQGHVEVGGVSRDVVFEDAGSQLDAQIDAAYRSKYRRYAASTLDRITSMQARSTTVRVRPEHTMP